MDQEIEKMEKTEMTKNKMVDQQRCKNCGGKSHPTESCPHKDKGKRCFKCNSFGHIGKYCEEKAETSNTKDTIEVERTSETDKVEKDQSTSIGLHISSWELKFFHGQIEIKAIMCMGFLESFIRKSCISKFDCLPEENRTPIVVKLYGQPVETMGSYELYMTNNNEGHYVKCHTVRDNVIQKDMILGMNFIRNVDINIRKGKMTVKRAMFKSDDDSSDTENENNTTVRNNMWWQDKEHI